MTVDKSGTLHRQIAVRSVSEFSLTRGYYQLKCLLTGVGLDLFTSYAEHPCSSSRNRSSLDSSPPVNGRRKAFFDISLSPVNDHQRNGSIKQTCPVFKICSILSISLSLSRIRSLALLEFRASVT